MVNYYLSTLKKLEDNGYKAYVVGGYVRNLLLGEREVDVDIITDAVPMEMKKIFNNVKSVNNEYGSIKLYVKNHIIDITTFRREIGYKNGKPIKIEYTKNLEEDLKRRAFTMNTLVMDKNGKIYDFMNGTSDIKNRIIKPVKDVNILFKEDASRLLRGLRFMSSLDMKFDKSIINYIKNNKSDFLLISPNKKKEEFDKLFKYNPAKFLKFIKDYGLEDYIGIKCDKFVYTNSLVASYAQLTISKPLPFTKYEKEQIKDIRRILKKKKVDMMDLYKYGLYISLCAGEILGLSKKKINLMYTNLPIKGIIEINITSEKICDVLNITPGKELGTIWKLLEKEIVNGKLINEEEKIIERLRWYNGQYKKNV